MAQKKSAFASAPLGEGGRFAACVRKVMAFYEKKGKSMTEERAKAICAKIGREAYGKTKMTKMAVAGRKK